MLCFYVATDAAASCALFLDFRLRERRVLLLPRPSALPSGPSLSPVPSPGESRTFLGLPSVAGIDGQALKCRVAREGMVFCRAEVVQGQHSFRALPPASHSEQAYNGLGRPW